MSEIDNDMETGPGCIFFPILVVALIAGAIGWLALFLFLWSALGG